MWAYICLAVLLESRVFLCSQSDIATSVGHQADIALYTNLTTHFHSVATFPLTGEGVASLCCPPVDTDVIHILNYSTSWDPVFPCCFSIVPFTFHCPIYFPFHCFIHWTARDTYVYSEWSRHKCTEILHIFVLNSWIQFKWKNLDLPCKQKLLALLWNGKKNTHW